MLRRNGPVMKSVESVLRLEVSLWGERFVKGAESVWHTNQYKELKYTSTSTKYTSLLAYTAE